MPALCSTDEVMFKKSPTAKTSAVAPALCAPSATAFAIASVLPVPLQ